MIKLTEQADVRSYLDEVDVLLSKIKEYSDRIKSADDEDLTSDYGIGEVKNCISHLTTAQSAIKRMFSEMRTSETKRGKG